MKQHLRVRMENGESAIGTMVTLPSTDVVEIMTLAGFEWLFIDGEHGALESGDIRALLTAAGDGIDCLVRVPVASEIPIKKALDLGASGIIAPQVNSAKAAAQVVSWARYPPEGTRGVGLARAHGYGMAFQEYLTTANDRLLVVVQVEHRDAVDDINAISTVDGVDCIMLGPYDLSASYGKTGQINDPEIVAAIDRVEAVCIKNNMPLGYFGLTADAVQSYIDRGFQLICVGVDTVMLGSSAQRIRRSVRVSAGTD
jgi:2-keto-3-deoxy-L-rhamnonate aldolase RhmA